MNKKHFYHLVDPRRSLYLKVSIFFLAGVIVPLSLVFFIHYINISKQTHLLIKQDMANLTGELGRIVEDKILDATKQITLLATSQTMQSDTAPAEEKLTLMRKFCDLFRVFNNITLIDVDGIVQTAVKYDFVGDWKYKKWFKSALDGNIAVSPVHIIMPSEKFVITVTSPITALDDKAKAVVAGQISMEKIWEITDRVKFGKSGFAFITDDNAKILCFPDKDKILRKLTPLKLQNKLYSDKSGFIEFSDEHNISKVCFYSTLNSEKQPYGQNWRIGIIQDKHESYAIVDKITIHTIIMATGCIFLMAVLVVIFGRTVIKPIMAIMHTMTEIANGNLETMVQVDSRDELGQLAESFNKMVGNLRISTTSIENLNYEITERKRAEENMKELNSELEQAVKKLEETNQELKNFVYIASHDLREPLRKISAFGSMVQKSLSGKIDGDDAENLNFMIDGANRMTKMIEGL
ncbi:MAG: cache domain-containing protein, partial [Sedimentisphaerales bacterium]